LPEIALIASADGKARFPTLNFNDAFYAERLEVMKHMKHLKIAIYPIIAAILMLFAACHSSDSNNDDSLDNNIPIVEAPINPDYLAWLERLNSGEEELEENPEERTGLIPSPYLLPEIDDSLTDFEALATRGQEPYSGSYPAQYLLPEIDGFPTDFEAKNKTDQGLYAATYPAFYSLLYDDYVTDIRNQGGYGTCWAHAVMASLESNIKKTSGATIDLSEWHLAWYAYSPINGFPAFSLNKNEKGILDQGGNAHMALAIMSRGPLAGGPVAEASAKYGSATPPSASAPSAVTIKSAIMFANGHINSKNTIKGLVQSRGAVYVGMPWKKNDDDSWIKNWTHTYNPLTCAFSHLSDNADKTHALAIVGWDDNYPRANFPGEYRPATNGAWIVRNSWGRLYHNAGYLWVSYDTPLKSVASFEAATNIDYNKIYQYDMHGPALGFGMYGDSDSAWFANIFTASGDECITDVAFYTPGNMPTEITIKTDVGATPATGTLASTTAVMLNLPGYYRIKLSRPVNVNRGQRFAVVVKSTNKSDGIISTRVSAALRGYSDSAKATSGVGFASPNGTKWRDVTTYDYTSSLCIKAFTQPRSTIPVTGVALNKSETTLVVGATETLVATVLPGNATNKTVTWTTSDDSVVGVSGGGLVTAIGAGTATITAITQNGGLTASCVVTVNAATGQATGVSLNKSSISLYPGDTELLMATVHPSSANQAVTWTSSNRNAASVNDNGLVTGLAAGATTISATTQDGGHKAECLVTVLAPVVYMAGHDGRYTGSPEDKYYPYFLNDSDRGRAILWENGNPRYLSSAYSFANSVFASGDDIYVAGCENNEQDVMVATLWKNGVSQRLSNVRSFASSVYVSGFDVYAAGRANNAQGVMVAKLWKNGVEQSLNSGSYSDGRAMSVFVSGNDVYVGGYVWNDINSFVGDVGVIWKNGTILLSNVSAESIFVDGGNVYSAGHKFTGTTILFDACVNGQSLSLNTYGINPHYRSIFVSGVDVYVCGAEIAYEEVFQDYVKYPTLWKNGARQYLDNHGPTDTSGTSAYSVFVSGDHAYVVGSYQDNGGWYWPHLWINGARQDIVRTGVRDRPYSVFVRGSNYNPDTIYTTGVSLNKAETTINVGTAETLVANVQPADATNKTVLYASSNTNAATVDGNGLVIGVAAGTATITVTTQDGGYKAECLVTVIPMAPGQPDVYSAGYSYFNNIGGGEAVLWKNSMPQRLRPNNVGNYPSSASSVYVFGNDVYVAGFEYDGNQKYAVLWKNGVLQRLSTTFEYSSNANSVFVSGNDVYVAGVEYDSNQEYAVLWKNGVIQRLSTTFPESRAYSVFVSGNDVYVAGYEWDEWEDGPIADLGGDLVPALWKNGVPHSYSAEWWGWGVVWINSVFVSGSDVYVTIDGHHELNHGYVGALFKNGVRQNLDTYNCVTQSVFVSGNDVYVAGAAAYDNEYAANYATLWKNGVPQRLSGNYSIANSVFVSGNDVYVAGEEGGYATLWINGAQRVLGPGGAKSVFVK
jgi:uncharacterized protein YjdB/C1A family cysteine protease